MLKRTLSLIALRFRRMWPVMLLLSTVATGIGWVWWQFDLFQIHDDERSAYDDGVKKFTNKKWFPPGQVKVSDDFIIVAIDDKTLTDVARTPAFLHRYGVWPFDRVIYADVLSYLHEHGARAVIFDATMEDAHLDPTGDLAMAETIRQTGVPFYLGFNVVGETPALPGVATPVNHLPRPPELPVEPDAGPGDGQPGADLAFPDEALPDTDTVVDAGVDPAVEQARLARVADLYAFPVTLGGDLKLPLLAQKPDDDDTDAGPRARYPVPAMEPMLDSAAGFGLVLQEEDEDGKMRKTAFAYSDGVNAYVTLPVAAAADLLDAGALELSPQSLKLGTRVVPIDADGTATIDYGGPLAARYRQVSLASVLRLKNTEQRRVSKERWAELEAQGRKLFDGKIVLIAGMALGTADVKATPFEASAPGVHKQVAVLDNLLFGRFITDAPFWVSLLFSFLVCFGSVALVLIVRNFVVDIGWPVLLWAGFFMLTGSFLVLTKVHILSAMPSFAGTIASVLATAWERVFSNKERERMKEMFRAYMEEDLVDAMVEQKELPNLGGEEMEVTAYFSDIRGFSSFSELFRAEPQGLMRLLNRYLSTVTPVLRAEGACIDKYIGDAVVALFGAPVRHADHALRACRGALAVQKVVGELRVQLKNEGLPDVYTRIGLNTDRMLVGNIGSHDLLDYTAIGDGMNLASRLEGTNKAYSTLILMGENTYVQVKEHVVAREVDLVRVAGKQLPTRIYELLGLKGEVPAEKLQLIADFEAALALYRARQFAEALTALEKVRAVDPADGPMLTLATHCQHFLEAPPPPEWDGVSAIEK